MKEVRFIDLASAGKEGEARYPSFLSRRVEWPCNSLHGQLIFQKHNMKLLFHSLSLQSKVTSNRGRQQMGIRPGVAQMCFKSYRRGHMWLQLTPQPILRVVVAL